MYQERIGHLLMSARKNAGLSAKVLSAKTGIPRRNISYWEDGEGDIGVDAFIRLAHGMGCNAAELIGKIEGRMTSERRNSVNPTE